MKTEQWLDSKVAFEDKKMAFKPFKIPGIVVQNNSNDQRPHTTTGGGTKASNVLQTNLLGIDEESVGPFSKRGAGGGHSTGPATVTTSLVEKQAPLLATRTWALCVQMDAWRLMCKRVSASQSCVDILLKILFPFRRRI